MPAGRPAIVRYSDLDAAIDYINGREKPLALYVFTGDSAVEHRVLTDPTAPLSQRCAGLVVIPSPSRPDPPRHSTQRA